MLFDFGRYDFSIDKEVKAWLYLGRPLELRGSKRRLTWQVMELAQDTCRFIALDKVTSVKLKSPVRNSLGRDLSLKMTESVEGS